MINTGFSEITTDRVYYNGGGFWYCEISVTGRCSFTCTYCNRLESDINETLIYDFINRYRGTLRHIQVTGGEPTEYKGLLNLCRFIKNSGVKLGLSTNGSASLDLYKSLNVDMFSISLDDYDIEILEHRGYKNISTVLNNIRELSKTSYVNIGIVIDKLNVDRINRIIEWILRCGVSDIKLSVSTKDDVMPVFDDRDYSKYPILNYRVTRFRQGKSMRGLSDNDNFRCHLLVNDISIVGDNHYPCLVYARERGNPIGSLKGNIEADRKQWYLNNIPKNDPICQKYCMDFKCEFNREAEKIF